MERLITAEEAAEFGEFMRSRREAEVALLLRKLIVDASRRDTDRHALKAACDTAKKLCAHAVLVSPVNVAAAHRFLAGSEVSVICLVGGTGESLPCIKRAEAKKALKQGARELRLVLCYSQLSGGNAAYLKKEVKKLAKCAKKAAVTVSLEDHSLGEDDVTLGVRAACEGKANGVCVRGENSLIIRALTAGAGRLFADCSGVENAAGFRDAVRAGASRVCTRFASEIAEELYAALEKTQGEDMDNAVEEGRKFPPRA